MQVLDIAFLGAPAIVRNAANALVAWYWQVKKVPYLPADYVLLEDLRGVLWTRLRAFEAFNVSIETPKIHCAAKFQETARCYGSCEHVTTDCYERAHKAHKAVFMRCAAVYVA